MRVIVDAPWSKGWRCVRVRGTPYTRLERTSKTFRDEALRAKTKLCGGLPPGEVSCHRPPCDHKAHTPRRPSPAPRSSRNKVTASANSAPHGMVVAFINMLPGLGLRDGCADRLCELRFRSCDSSATRRHGRSGGGWRSNAI